MQTDESFKKFYISLVQEFGVSVVILIVGHV